MSSKDSRAPVHTISLRTILPISLCAAATVLMHSVFPQPEGPTTATFKDKS